MATLWVHVKEAAIEPGDAASVLAVVKVAGTSYCTQQNTVPKWNESFHFNVKGIDKNLQVEIYQMRFFRRFLVGLASVPLYNIRHSNKPREGLWSALFLPDTTGCLKPTTHRIKFDTHFELPSDIPDEELELLERKLDRLDGVLEEEISLIEKQHHKLATGKLSFPPAQRSEVTIQVTPESAGLGSGTAEVSKQRAGARSDVLAPPKHSGGVSPASSDGGDSDSLSADEHSHAPDSRHRWKSVVLSPTFQRKVMKKRQQGGGGGGSSVLADLVAQLSGWKKDKLDLNPLGFCKRSTDFMKRSKSVIDTRERQLGPHKIDEALRIHIYQNTIAALLYPTSDLSSHSFETWTAHKPTHCSVCQGLLWGLAKQGVKCAKCHKVTHGRCSSLVNQECHSSHDSKHSKRDSSLSAITEIMRRTQTNNVRLFQVLRMSFGISEGEHEECMSEIRKKILERAKNFDAVLSVKVIAAQGLNLKSISDRRIIVTVAVGNQKKSTKASKESNPVWNETFDFHCTNYHHTVQVRVWNERDTAVAKLALLLTKEGDMFLGEKIVEVRRIGSAFDAWYKLEKRTEDSQVSGVIKMSLSAQVAGEKIMAPFHVQYWSLHEQLFLYHHVWNKEPLVLISAKPDEVGDEVRLKHLPDVAQQIVDEFALRYSIEPIYRSMVHFNLLVNNYTVKSALKIMENLLKNLKFQIFSHAYEDNSIRAVGLAKLLEEYFEANNFGRDQFARVLEKLLNSLRLDFQRYRELYPASDHCKLEELVQSCEVMEAVNQFQRQVMGIMDVNLSEMILHSVKECLESTFEFIANSSIPPNTPTSLHPGLSKEGKPFHFFYKLLEMMYSVIQDDKSVYALCFARFCNFDLGHVSASELWRHFGKTLQGLFDEEQNRGIYPPAEYMQLLFTIKNFYDSVISVLPKELVGEVADYPVWFLPCIRHWLSEFKQQTVGIVSSAWDNDRSSGFPRYEGHTFSSSVFDMFCFLQQGYDMLYSLESNNAELNHQYHYEFSLMIRNVLQHYLDTTAGYFPQAVEDSLHKACMLLNNLHVLRQNLQDLYGVMGGEKSGPECTEVLQSFQTTVLSKQLTHWSSFLAKSFAGDVVKAVASMQTELIKVKGSCSRDEAKAIATPLLDMFTEKALVIAEASDPALLQRVIKELSMVIMEGIHSMLLPSLRLKQQRSEYPFHSYSAHQCAALETVLDILKEVITGNQQVALKQSVLDKSIRRLRAVISIYRQTTEKLIAEFITYDNAQSEQSIDVPCGEVSLAFNANRHISTRELDVTVRVISADNLKPFSAGGAAALKPYIEIALLQSNSSSCKKFSTVYKSGSTSLHFNQAFNFSLASNVEGWELQVTAKNHSRFGADKVIGVALVNAFDLKCNGNISLEMSSCLALCERRGALLNVLSQRTNDEGAKEFVALKTQCRTHDLTELTQQSLSTTALQ